MKSLKILLALSIFLIFCSTAWADIPNLINFQGILDSAGNPLANRTVSVEFKIYAVPAGGTVFWSETQSVTTNAGGVFNVVLGSSNPIPDSVFDDTVRYLGIKVGTDAEMTPRQQIVSNAYVYRVSTVDGASGGVISGDVAIQSDLTVSGNVGIGTSPGKLLDIAGNFAEIRFRDLDNAVEGQLSAFGAGLVDLRSTTNHPLTFSTNNTERMRITGTGNVGIGTSSPLSQLHLESSNPISEGMRIYNTSATGDPAISFLTDGVFQYTLGVDNDDGDKLQISAGSTLNSSELLTLTSTGNVGIGTTSPSSKLDVNLGTTDAKFTGFGTNNTGLNLINTDVTSRTWALWALGNSGLGGPAKGFAIADVTIPATRLVIDVAGNVGIGTANPTQKLDVSGIGAIHMLAQTTSSGNVAGVGVANPERQWFLQVRGELGGAPFVIRDGTAGEYRLAINSTGNVGIGTTSPGNILTVVQNSSTDPIADAWTTYSSAEYKQGIHELTDQEYSDALQKLLATPVVKYRYKGQSFMDKEKIGIVIEEAPQEIISEGNAKAASLSEYISLLHAGLKAQQTEIESLKQMLKQLQDEQSKEK